MNHAGRRPLLRRALAGRRIALAAVLAVALALGGLVSALAVHDLGLFELDRKATDDTATTGDDWATLHGGGGSAAAFTGVLADIAAPGTQFHGGGSKDNNDVSEWLWNDGEPLDKDDITNAYAAAYVNTTDTGDNNVGDLIIYYGLDRFANNGSAQVGFWFFQNAIGLTDIRRSGGFEFSGVHAVGDILVQSNFSQGGIIDSISVFKWVGSGGSHGTLDLVFSAADCIGPPGTGSDDAACATVNRADTPAPWPFTPKFGTSGTFPTGSFFEGGVNISRLVPDAGCLSSVLAETRSSTPFDARLKDFVLGSFDLCRIEVEKTGDTLSKVGDPVDYTITIRNTGAVKLYMDDISDSLLGDIVVNGVVQSNLFVTGNTCADTGKNPLAPGDSCTITLTRTVQAGDPDPLPNTVTVVYRGKSDLSGTAVTDSDDHSVNLFQPAVTLSKTGDTLSKVGDAVDYQLTVTNTSSADSPNLSCTLSDPLLGLSKSLSLAPGASDTTAASRTVQPGDPDPLVNTATVTCTVDAVPSAGFPGGNQLSASASHSVDLVHPGLAVAKTCAPTTARPGDTITYTCTISNTGDVGLNRVSITDSLKGDLTNPANFTASTCGPSLAPGASCTITYTLTAPSGTTTLVNTVTATYQVQGLPNQLTQSSSCTVSIPGEGCTPGFWKNHTSLWDQSSDPIAAAAGFTTTTSFNEFFGLTSAQSGFPDSLTMADALSLGGGGGQKLARQGVAALLNLAANLNYPLPAGINNATDLKNAIKNAYLSRTFEPLAQQLADANELNCPLR